MDILETRAKLLGSLLLFTKVFFEEITKRRFIISNPFHGESHMVLICRELTKVFNLETKNLMINMPPGWGKSEHCKMFVAWALARYPDCNFLYISKDHDLSAKHTSGIKNIIDSSLYRSIFDSKLLRDTNAKDFFKTNAGGTIAAFGSSGGVTGHDAGLPSVNRFSGAIIIDDIHKPEDVHSDSCRERVWRNYFETIMPRRRDFKNVPIIFIGQRLHEDDACQRIINGTDGLNWRHLTIEALSEDRHSRYPEICSSDDLINMERFSPYVFHSQYQQNPIPAGGGLYKADNFVILPSIPNNILKTFITCDTAETQDKYNDATVFSFWGVYKINDLGVETDVFALHWLDCMEIRIEPKDLESEFINFYNECMSFKIKPSLVAIEKKSTGVTLISNLKTLRGINILEVNRGKNSGSKSDRFISIQPYVNNKLISFDSAASHTSMCIAHCIKITANNAHRHDDIADTLYDAVKIALIDKFIINSVNKSRRSVVNFSQNYNSIKRYRGEVYDSRR